MYSCWFRMAQPLVFADACVPAVDDPAQIPICLETGANIPTGAGAIADESLDYDAILRATSDGLMARLKIPSIDLDLPVYHGTADATLLMRIFAGVNSR